MGEEFLVDFREVLKRIFGKIKYIKLQKKKKFKTKI